jgi:hypothetical protein
VVGASGRREEACSLSERELGGGDSDPTHSGQRRKRAAMIADCRPMRAALGGKSRPGGQDWAYKRAPRRMLLQAANMLNSMRRLAKNRRNHVVAKGGM